jgi:hypothetical protein
VITVARAGPTSAISRKNSTNASAVQTTPRVTTAAITGPDGMPAGACAIPNGRYTAADTSRDAATTPSSG